MRKATCHPDRKHHAFDLCCACYKRDYRKRDYVKERTKAYNQRKYQENREEILATKKKDRQEHPEKYSSLNKKWRDKNRERLAEYKRKRRANNINARLAFNLRCRLSDALKNNYKRGSSVRNLGCSMAQFKLFVENQFQEGMNWSNYGEWHLDHVIPLSVFDLTDKRQFLEATNWLNYQPLWASENLRKGPHNRTIDTTRKKFVIQGI